MSTNSTTDQKSLQTFKLKEFDETKYYIVSKNSEVSGSFEYKQKLYKYKFRAECKSDVEKFFKLFKPNIFEYTISPVEIEGYPLHSLLPDCDVEFLSNKDIKLVRICMSCIRDGHVMLESLNYSLDYTGERYYDKSEIN